MALAAILMEQTVVMCLFLLLGYLMGKLGWVTQKGSGEITNLLVRIVVPAAIINSFLWSAPRNACFSSGFRRC